jgi:hypothetical protein
MNRFDRIQTWRWVALATVVLLAGAWVLLFHRYPAWDFRNNLWGPAHLLLHGQHPYDLTALERLSAAGGVPFYPSIWFPTVVGVGLPLGALPLSNAANLWLLISLAAALGTVLLVYRSLIPCQQPDSMLRAGLLVMLFVPLYAHLNQGQVSLLVLASAVAGWVLLEQGHAGWAGAVLSLGWAKPQLVILIWPALAWRAAKQGKIRLVCLGWLAGSLGQTLPLWILDPTWPAGYLEALRANPNWLQPNIRSLLAFWSNNEAVGWLVALLALGIGVAWLSRLWRRGSGGVALAWTLALTPPLSPFSWSYDQVLLLPLLAITLVPARPGARRTVAWVIFFACQVVYVALRLGTSSDAAYAWYPPVLLVLSALLGSPWAGRVTQPTNRP